jgi:molybdate transport system ATP-binding protein/molybdate transport system permease protein
MPLEVHVEKKLAAFTLSVRFAIGDAPLSVLGASGAGKTMLLRTIAGLERPDHGRIVLNGQTLFDSEAGVDIPARDRRIGMLFQGYALFPHKTVATNVAFGLAGLKPTERAARIDRFTSRTNIDLLANRNVRTLSGGEQQRVALARALATEPQALLLDEPLSALDTHLRSQMQALLEETFFESPRPTLLVTHNVEEAYRMSAEMLVLLHGRVAAFGRKREVFERPASMEVALLTGCKNMSRVRVEADGTVNALDWDVRLRFPELPDAEAKFIGIRAHHLVFDALTQSEAQGAANVVQCWLAHVSEGPFRSTVFLRTRELEQAADEIELQAELTREEWARLSGQRQPWGVRLAPEKLFLMKE